MGAFQRDIEAALRDFVAYYNNERDRESFDNVTPADVYFGRQYAVLTNSGPVLNATTPPSKILGGVVDYLEHETGLEPATPTLARRCVP